MKQINIDDITCEYCKLREAVKIDNSKKPICKVCMDYHKEEILNHYYSETPQSKLQCEVYCASNSFDFSDIEVGKLMFINDKKHEVVND